jgi:hypothetical protein
MSVPRAAHRRRSPHPRPLALTAAAAAVALTGLWFIPSASAGQDAPSHAVRAGAGGGVQSVGTHARIARAESRHGVDPSAYAAGGATCLAVGAGMAVYVTKRNRRAPLPGAQASVPVTDSAA